MSTTEYFAFEVWAKGLPEWARFINARTANKAKYEYLVDLQEAWPGYGYIDLRVRKVGPCHTSAEFRRNANYRGLPDVECGQHVRIGVGSGVIVGHNYSANFNVLFDDDSLKYAGLTLNVHPSIMKMHNEG